MRVTFLGTGSAMPTGERVQTGLLLETDGEGSSAGDEDDGGGEAEPANLLVDCGSGVLHRLARTDPGYEGVSTVLLTHHHLDHVADLLPLLKARWLAGNEFLTVVGPEGTEALLEGLLGVHEYLQGRVDLDVREVTPGDFSIPGFDVAAMAVEHSMYCLAYRFAPATGAEAEANESEGEGSKSEGPAFVYSGDTEAMADLIEFADRATLAHDCSFPDEVDVSNHPTPAQLGAALAAADGDPERVYLTHLYPHTRGRHEAMLESIGNRWDGDIRFVRDLRTISVD